jgi:acetylornithine/N-succinyldiaminopimelate aminotransferase
MMAAGTAIFKELTKPGFMKKVVEKGDYLQTKLNGLSAKFGLREVRGKGLLVALELNEEIGPKIVEEALNRGLLINSPRKNTLRFMPALNVSRAEINQMTAILEKILETRGEWIEKK